MRQIKKSIKNISTLARLFFIPFKNSLFATVFNAIGIPLCMMVFTWMVTGRNGDYAFNSITGSTVMGILSMTISTLAIKIVNMMQGDGMEFFHAYGIKKFEFIIAILLSEFIVFFPSNLAILLIGTTIFHIKILFKTVLMVYLCSFFMLVLAIFPIGTIVGTKSTNYNSAISISNIITYGLTFFTPIYYDISILPQSLQNLTRCFPTTVVATYLKSALRGEFRVDLFGIVIISLWSLIGFLWIIKRMKWTLN